ncbi:YeeE/YedE family protein [Desulfuribacillus alkaliarsenatis]|uniref:Uncharacterized protein n=1 Tax=Desulfuribacillus alkaliarsenatis TaxID=766136 RepID=A0A1E5G1H4_9FIRM|nr:YeeE/YedE family protein [Desulfuribacillus alkaliarsenatis]OEF96745.1 hypothetical protein BHF68_06640 [Desulfuribacillus alkaliarsenatis]
MNKEKQRQVGYMILGASAVLLLITSLMSHYNIAIAWFLGLSFGFVFQRSRFCTVGAIRDVFLLQNFTLAKSILLYLALATSIFGFLYAVSLQTPITITSKLEAVGILTVIGAFVFGIGMVIAGGCASGTLIRMGEGLVMQWWAFLGLISGLLIGSWTYPLYVDYNYGFPQLFLADSFGIGGAMVAQLLVLASIYLTFKWVETKNQYDINYANATEVSNKASEEVAATNFKNYKKVSVENLLKPWSYKWGAISLAILTSLVFLWNKTWGITGGLTHLFAGLTNKFFINISQWEIFARVIDQSEILLWHPLVPLVIAMVVGSFMSALLAGEFRIRSVAHNRFVVSALVGGFLMGIGARLANGCNVSAVMSGIPSLSLHGWVFLLFMTLGVLVGIRILTRYLV